MTGDRVDVDDLTFDDGVLFEGELFTGTSLENWPEGSLRSEQDYDLGKKHGRYREFDRSGQLLAETPHAHGVCHGLDRRWYPDGKLAAERFCQFGTVLWEMQWNRDGQLVSQFHLDENDSRYQRVREEQKARAERARQR